MPHCFVEAILKITFKKIFIDPREGGDEIPEQSLILRFQILAQRDLILDACQMLALILF